MKRKLFCLCLSLAVLGWAWPACAEEAGEPPAASQPEEPASPPEETEFPAQPSEEDPPPEEGGITEEGGAPEEPQEPTATPAAEETPAPEEAPAPTASPAAEEPEPTESPVPEETPAPEEEPEEAVIRVQVPVDGQVIVNPYGMAVKVEGSEKREQVIHMAQPLLNLGQTAVDVHAAAVGLIPEGSRVRFVAQTPSPDSLGREAFVYVEFRNQDSGWAGGYSGAENQVLVTESGSEKQQVLRLAPESQGYFRLNGSLSAPESNMWTESDTIRVRLVFTFTNASGAGQPSAEQPAASLDDGWEATEAPVGAPVQPDTASPAGEDMPSPSMGGLEEMP